MAFRNIKDRLSRDDPNDTSYRHVLSPRLIATSYRHVLSPHLSLYNTIFNFITLLLANTEGRTVGIEGIIAEFVIAAVLDKTKVVVGVELENTGIWENRLAARNIHISLYKVKNDTS